jgi:antitoxin YefM
MLNDAISYSELRENLKTYLDRVNDDHVPLLVKRKNGRNVIIMDADDYASMDETDYLLRSPANAKRLMEALERDPKDGLVFEDFNAFKKHFDNAAKD